jgi:hypothetical protein
MSNDHTSHPTSVDVSLNRADAERASELLLGLAAILRAEPSEDPLDILAELNQGGAFEPLRYGRPMAGPYVAEIAEDVARRLKDSLDPR